MSGDSKRVRFVEPKPAGFHVYGLVKLPRLGLPILGTILRNRGFDVRIYCQDLQEIDYADLYQSDLVGISVTTSTAPGGYQLADRLAQRGIPVIIGGPHATFLPDESLQHAPYCVRGEGEETIVELTDRLMEGAEPDDVAGLSYLRDGEARHNPSRDLVHDLDSLPFPDLSLIQGHRRIRITPILTSRGCPFDCTFCSVTEMFGRKYRLRNSDSVIEELKQYTTKQVFFYDDNFAANRTRAKVLCEKLIRSGLTAGWSAQARVDVARDEELLRLMQRSGCFMLYVGLESVNPVTLDAFNKHQKVEEIEECIRKLHKYNIMVHGMFITGADDDEPQTIHDTVKFSLKNKIDTVQFSMLTPIPGTRLYRQLDKEGRIFSKDWALYDAHHVVFEPNKMTPYVLQKETVRAMKQFYALWQCLKPLLRFRFVSAVLRYYGNRQVKRWEKSNKEFVEWVRSLGARTKNLTARKKPAAE
jgi:anaerobic magnesium-protoporphyrin IX monomethyl ester cyclase